MVKLPNEEGSITAVIHATDPDWTTNEREYRFQPVIIGLHSCEVSKHSDGFLRILITGTGHGKIEFVKPVPPPGEKGVHVAVMWSQENIKLFLNGSLVETRKLSKSILNSPDCYNC